MSDRLSCNLSENAIIKYQDEPEDVKRIKRVLEMICVNCVKHSLYHNARYHFYRRCLYACFRIPSLILSSLNGFFAVGLQKYIHQHTISLTNAGLSLFCGILTGIEILLNLQKRMEAEMDTYKRYYKLNVEIQKELIIYSHKNDEKMEKIKDFLEKKYNEYQGIIASSNIVTNHNRIFRDEFEILSSDTTKNEYSIDKLMGKLYQTFNICDSDCNKKGCSSCYKDSTTQITSPANISLSNDGV